MDYVLQLSSKYEIWLEQADKRVADWTLMWAFWPTLALTGLYLIVVFIGPKLMANRKPFELRWPLFFYNMFLVGVNLHIFTEVLISTYKLNYSYSCQEVHYGNDPTEYRLAKALWWFYISKMFEFFDTIFFILRKKDNQISFLHVYHHATMFPLWWIGVKWVPGGQAFFGAMINSFVHVLMYSYYGLSALGPHMQKYLWWKQYLTIIQLIQFIAGMTHAAQSIYVGCKFPLWMQWALVVYGASIFGLFINFYFHSYIRPKRTGKRTIDKQGVANNHVNEKNGINGNSRKNESNVVNNKEKLSDVQKKTKTQNGKAAKHD